MRIPPLQIGLAPPSAIETALDFDALYEAYFENVARWARRLGGSRVDADDVIQEVFVIASQGLSKLRPDANLTSWLFRITENVVRHHRRGQRWREMLLGSPVAESLGASEPSVSEDIELRELRRMLQLALDGLSERYRVPLVLYELDEQSAEEIAGLLDLTVSAVWTRLSRGREKLLRRYEALERGEARRGRRSHG